MLNEVSRGAESQFMVHCSYKHPHTHTHTHTYSYTYTHTHAHNFLTPYQSLSLDQFSILTGLPVTVGEGDAVLLKEHYIVHILNIEQDTVTTPNGVQNRTRNTLVTVSCPCDAYICLYIRRNLKNVSFLRNLTYDLTLRGQVLT